MSDAKISIWWSNVTHGECLNTKVYHLNTIAPMHLYTDVEYPVVINSVYISHIDVGLHTKWQKYKAQH